MDTGYDKPIFIASHFGFTPIETPKISSPELNLADGCLDHPHLDAAERAAFIRAYMDREYVDLPHPLAFVYKKPIERKKLGGYSLHYLGGDPGLSESILLRTGLSILSEHGHKNLKIEINSLGDKESLSVFERELTNHYKKHDLDLEEDLHESIKADLFNIFYKDHPELMKVRETLPTSMNYLNASSRNHFKEVLEYLEKLEVEFSINPHLLGDRSYCSHAIFAITETLKDKKETLALGYSYSRLARKVGFRREMPMVGMTVFMDGKKAIKKYKNLPKPKFYLIQLGRDAKMRSISVLEFLRANRIPVRHLMGKDKISAQLTDAETYGTTHLIIIGQREALENTATVREIATRAQSTIPLMDLPKYLKSVRG